MALGAARQSTGQEAANQQGVHKQFWDKPPLSRLILEEDDPGRETCSYPIPLPLFLSCASLPCHPISLLSSGLSSGITSSRESSRMPRLVQVRCPSSISPFLPPPLLSVCLTQFLSSRHLEGGELIRFLFVIPEPSSNTR